MKNSHRGFIVPISIIIIIAAIIIGWGIYYYLQQKNSVQQNQTVSVGNNQVSNATSTNRNISIESKDSTNVQSSILLCGDVSLTLPADYMNLPNLPQSSQTSELDNRGCYINATSGCVCIKSDSISGTSTVVISINPQNPQYKVPTSVQAQNQYLKTMGALVKKDTEITIPGASVTNEYSTIAGFPALISTSKLGNATAVNIAFIKGLKLYRLAFTANQSTFNFMWPSVQESIDSLKFND